MTNNKSDGGYRPFLNEISNRHKLQSYLPNEVNLKEQLYVGNFYRQFERRNPNSNNIDLSLYNFAIEGIGECFDAIFIVILHLQATKFFICNYIFFL